ncbi:MAG: precorrin-6Y C5,15-methyltransferase (decarboxylating) subunit CbiT [Lachnospiraceae bacterium]|nr:precorrin-6Y C5,15-methyltransferase (decarboxylating) subunit CbiT [Lachnospiraceae bacterium]
MKQIIVFAGTTEGRLLSEWLSGEGLKVLACVATEYGSLLMKDQEHLEVRQGRLTRDEMKLLFQREEQPLVLDATHPYAAEVSENIRTACESAGCEYLRLIRSANHAHETPLNTKALGMDMQGGEPAEQEQTENNCVTVGSVKEAADWLAETKGRILVTTGSKELHYFTGIPNYQERVYARVLATPEVVTHCRELGFTGKHLICMQGPFSKEMNTAMLRQFDASWMVTKESGKEGGFDEKLEAAKEAGAKVVLVRRPPEQKGVSVEEGIALLRERFSLETYPTLSAGKREENAGNKVILAGIGMGTPETMTKEVWEAFQKADCILGAGRMLESFQALGKPMLNAYDPDKMTAYVREHPEYKRIAVALSGDVGFYSGAKRLIGAFEQEGLSVELMPGISSVAYLCGRLRIAWEDVKLMSIHGRKGNLIGAVRENLRTFTLLGGKDNAEALCRELLYYGMDQVTVYIGERLHYQEERITKGTPGELLGQSFDGLCAALIENPDYKGRTPSCIPDEEFVRGKAPMTKSEIRCLSVAKLELCRDSLVYDIGAGTGSVSVEMAFQVPEGTVWAIEKEREACKLIGENCKKFQVSNVEIREGTAPEALADLPAPTHAFIGGSSGNLKEILELLLKKNPKIRVVINAVTLETIGETAQCLKELPFAGIEAVQVQMAKGKTLGRYQLMMGQNPVYIFTAEGRGL